jgi:methionyl-tRNA formyltransferase
MKVAIIGRTWSLLETAKRLKTNGHEIALVVTSKEAPDCNVTSNDFRTFANELGCVFVHDPKITKARLEELVPNFSIDIGISINYSGVIDDEVTSLFPLGILNAHGGDLPRYRGNACQAWAIINGEDRIGLCIHRMIGGELDSGNILHKNIYPIDINTRIGTVYEWFDRDIPLMFLDVINKLNEDNDFVLESQSNDPSKALRCYPRKPEDGKIDWHASAEDIVRLINASSEPYQGAFCLDREGAIVRIWRASVFYDEEIWCGVAGQIVQYLENGEMVLLTGKGKIKISEIEYNGIRAVPRTFFKSLRVRFY